MLIYINSLKRVLCDRIIGPGPDTRAERSSLGSGEVPKLGKSLELRARYLVAGLFQWMENIMAERRVGIREKKENPFGFSYRLAKLLGEFLKL